MPIGKNTVFSFSLGIRVSGGSTCMKHNTYHIYSAWCNQPARTLLGVSFIVKKYTIWNHCIYLSWIGRWDQRERNLNRVLRLQGAISSATYTPFSKHTTFLKSSLKLSRCLGLQVCLFDFEGQIKSQVEFLKMNQFYLIIGRSSITVIWEVSLQNHRNSSKGIEICSKACY